MGWVNGTNTIFMNKMDVPQEWQKDVTYGCIVCNYRKGKIEPNRTRLTVKGDRTNYLKDCGMPKADLLTIKILLNSVILTQKQNSLQWILKKFYLNNPLKR